MPDGDFRVKPDLSPQQRQARDSILRWLRGGDRQTFHLAGYPGTGKTEFVTRLGRELPGVQFSAFAGKAASVLRQRGADNATTLHSLLYGAPIVTKTGDLVWRRRDGKLCASLIVADECSTIDKTLGRDLLKAGIKVLVTGDACQLPPPVCGAAFFGDKPDFMLTEIHRQAAGSQPLRLATAVRKGELARVEPFHLDAVAEADICICALNRTRQYLNRAIRRARGIAGKGPVIGDRAACLQNNPITGVLNGTLWTIAAIDRVPANDLLLRMVLIDDIGDGVQVIAHDDGFFCTKLNLLDRECDNLDLFDFGYALTCHKAQGSEWPNVVVIDETDSVGFRLIAGDMPLPEFRKRWLYTAVSRARSSVAVMGAPR